MSFWPESTENFRSEQHFGDRVVLCRAGRPTGFHDLLADSSRRNPRGDALICGGLRLDWSSHEALTGRVAAGLFEAGIGRGDRVVLFLHNRAEYVVLLFAIARIGAISVPVGTREQASGLAYIVEQSGAAMVICEAELADRVPVRPDLARVVLQPCGDDPCFGPLASETTVPAVAVDEEDAAFILYTSGTTGRPKGAIVSHLAIVHAALGYCHTMSLGPEDRSVCAVPLSHVTGLAAMVSALARAGGTLVVMPGFAVDTFLETASRTRMTHTVLVPAMYHLILARADLSRHALDTWRVGGFGGAQMPVPTIERLARELPRLGLMNCYGATETVIAAAIMPSRYVLSHSDCVGVVAPTIAIKAMDEMGREVPNGTPGELWISGPSVICAYWRNEEASRTNIVGGWWRSGDLGSIDQDGFVRVHDRIKDMINRGGYKIFSAEVESVLMSHPAVLEAAVIGQPCPVLGERVHAVVVLRDGIDTADLKRELIALCAGQLADYKVPETIHPRDTPLPRNANGKVMKTDLRNDLLQPSG